MPPIDLLAMAAVLLFGLAVLGAGLLLASIGAGRVRVARRLRDAGPIPLRDVPAADGYVAFEGTARASDEGPLEAPLSGTSCLAYAVTTRSRDGTGADATWTLDGRASAGVPFAVDDGGDRVTVDPANAVLSLDGRVADGTAWTDRSELSAGARDRLAAVGLTGAPAPESGDEAHREYRERRLEPGTDVRVFGASVAETGDRESASDAPITVAGDDWFEITTGGQSTVIPDRRRSGSLYVIFGGLLAIPGLAFTLAGLVGLVSTFVL